MVGPEVHTLALEKFARLIDSMVASDRELYPPIT
jgi:hypothetical protein